MKMQEMNKLKVGFLSGCGCLRLNNEDHCLKVLGLEALKMRLYLLWLARCTARRTGNLSLLSLNIRERGLLISSFLFSTAVLIIEIVSGEARWLPAISACS